MKNNEHLALFVLGIGTLGITFLLLFAMNDRNATSQTAVDRQVSVSVAQADIMPQPQTQAPAQMSMDVLERQVAETFAKTAAYLGRGTYEEKEHIVLLERLEFYSGMSSIKPEQKQTAQDLIKDMGRLLTLKESVARQLQLAGQINAVESDVQIHLAKGQKNEAVARKLMDRIESLYAINGLTEHQNSQLRDSLAALKSAYKETQTRVVSAVPAPSRQVDAPRSPKPIAPVAKVEVETKVAPTPVVKAPEPAPVPEKAEPPVQKVQAAASTPKKTQDPKAQITKERYYKVMTLVSSYFVERKYNQEYHDKLTADLLEVSKGKEFLEEGQQERLSQTITKMKRIDDKYRSPVAAK